MKRFTILAVAVISATFALDLEAVQKSSKRLYEYPLPIMEKRKIQNPSYADMYSVYKSDPLASRTSDSQQYYRRVQELLANIVAQKNRADPGWLENLRQREMNLRQLTDIRPPYDQDDFPAYSQMPQEDSLRWAPPLSQVVRPPPAEKHQASYRGHKQFPYSTRVPQEEMMKKRSVESKIDTQPKGLEAAPKTEKKDDSKAGAQDHANATSGNKKMSPDEFKKWLTEEYYRNMAMSFATMRKKRSILEQGGGGGNEMSPSNRDEGLAFEKLRLMEDSLLEDALQDIMHGTPERHGTKKKPQVAGALDVAQDIDNLKKILQSLVVDTQRLKAINEAEISAALKNVGRDAEPARDDETAECPELRMLMNGCSALRGMFPPDPIRGQFVASCNWHEVCYSCGAQHGISADQCDRSFLLDMRVLCGELGSCNPNLTSLLLTPLHKKRVFIKQNTLPICEKSCVVNFLART